MSLTSLLGLVADDWIGAVVIVQPALAVWFFPAGFAALAVIAPPQARNLAVGFTIPFGYLIGGGAIPTFIGMMGDAKLFALGFTITGLLITAAGVLAISLKLPRLCQSRPLVFGCQRRIGCSINCLIMKARRFRCENS